MLLVPVYASGGLTVHISERLGQWRNGSFATDSLECERGNEVNRQNLEELAQIPMDEHVLFRQSLKKKLVEVASSPN
jgi:hypothetical protein